MGALFFGWSGLEWAGVDWCRKVLQSFYPFSFFIYFIIILVFSFWGKRNIIELSSFPRNTYQSVVLVPKFCWNLNFRYGWSDNVCHFWSNILVDLFMAVRIYYSEIQRFRDVSKALEWTVAFCMQMNVVIKVVRKFSKNSQWVYGDKEVSYIIWWA